MTDYKRQLFFLDFEFFNTQEKFVELVCCVASFQGKIKRYILTDDDGKEELKAEILKHIEAGSIFCSYAFEAEARALISLFMDFDIVKKIDCLDLYILYRQITNSNDELCLGEHFDGTSVFTVTKSKKSKYISDDSDEEEGSCRKVPHSLVAATYRLLGIKRDSEHKEAMRERILRGSPFDQWEMEQILAYCEEDVVLLPELLKAMLRHYKGKLIDLLELSKYAVYSAIMVSTGYPVNVEWLKRLCAIAESEIDSIKQQTSNAIKEKFGLEFFSFVKGELKENQKVIREHIAKTYAVYAVSEKTGQPSLNEDALKSLATADYYNSPQTAIDYFCRYRKLVKSLKSLKPAKGRKHILDYVGSDGRIRPNMGIFVAQTSRSQPSSNSFVHLKAAVFRFVVHPPEGRVLFGIDYKSQEFLIAAANSEDENMLEAYYSGDPYMYLAKNIGLCPPNATKETHPKERKLAKTLELALTYGMGVASVAQRLGVDEDEARALIRSREQLYCKYTMWKKNLLKVYYSSREPIFLYDGWYLDVDNENSLSVGNFPGQGTGAAVMRRAVRKCMDAGLTVIFTLHDALYFECDLVNAERDIHMAANLMREAFKDVCGKDIFVDICAWGFKDIVKPEKRRMGLYDVTCCGLLYEDKVSETEQETWHKRIVEN